MPSCYICGASNSDRPLVLKDSFTAHSRCKCPTSDKLCDRCYDCIEGKYKQCWYYNPNKKAWSKLWGRNWSWLISEKIRLPQFEECDRGDNLLKVFDLPTREQIREWLLNPPEPPFTIAIADSGQKHIYPFSVESHSRDLFPVLFEESLIYCDRSEFTQLLNTYEAMMTLKYIKTEIDSGQYRVMAGVDINRFLELEKELGAMRSSELFKLAGFVAKND